MSKIHQIGREDIIWGYMSQFFSVASSLILIPFVFKYLPTEDVGVWYVFITIVALVQLLEFGFLPTISRYISYVYAGAKTIEFNMVPTYQEDAKVNIPLLSGVITSARKIYIFVSAIACLVVCIGGVGYLYVLDYSGDKTPLYLAWLIYGGSSVILFYYGYYNSILKGRGSLTQLNKSVVFSKFAGIVVSILLLIQGYGMMALAVGMFTAVIIDRLLVRLYCFSDDKTVAAFKCVADKSYVDTIWKSSRLMGAVQLGNFLTIRSSVLIVSSFIGLEAAAMYGFTLQITSVAVIISAMYFGLQLPLMNSLRMKNDFAHLRKTFLKSMKLAWLLFFTFAITLLLLGDLILSVFMATAKILPPGLLAVFLLAAFLEMTHSLSTAYLTTSNQIVFMKAILITGLFISLFSIVMGSYFGLWGVVLSQLFLQLIYNNWKWPLLACKELEIKWHAPHVRSL